jgi:hypothetical protein
LADDTGREFNVEVQAVAPGAKVTLLRPFKQPPLYRENPESRFWCKHLLEARETMAENASSVPVTLIVLIVRCILVSPFYDRAEVIEYPKRIEAGSRAGQARRQTP